MDNDLYSQIPRDKITVDRLKCYSNLLNIYSF